ncbi:MAG: SPOR domain-containing protein [Chromatiales bacterium]|nr:SPOR domain-containing protein [Gammaproteobacteria bacterium]MBW6476913.1 SPOR domain-containing protein [Chromatiales bacterium]
MAKARRDYAKRTTTRKRKQPLPGWLWMLGGLSLGLLVAFLIYLQPLGAGRDSGPGSARTSTSTDTRVVTSPASKPAAAPQRQEPVVSAKAEPAPRQGMQFDFYNILPELEIVIPDSELQRADTGEQHTYYLQVGSFRRSDDAEARKAELLLLNFVPSVQTVTIDGNQTWHRVRLGPFTERRRVDQAGRRLQDNGIDFIMLREKG